MDAFITYEGLPIKSGGAHQLGKKQVDFIYSDTRSFLNRFTNVNKPASIELTFCSSIDGSYKTIPNLWRLIKEFGSLPKWKRWSFPDKKQDLWTWSLTEKQIPKAFRQLQHFMSLPQNEYGPLTLLFLWTFHFIDPETNEVLKEQDKIPVIDERQRNSQVYLRLGQKSTISVWLAFPFSELNDESEAYLKKMSASLPFNPSIKHWRIWKKSKANNWTPTVIEPNIN